MLHVDYFARIIFPYFKKKRGELKLPADYPALLLFDNFNGQCTEQILKLIDDHHVNVIIIPAKLYRQAPAA